MTSERNKKFETFMNDQGEIRDRPFRIIKTKALRNPTFERRMVEEMRERNLYYLGLAGTILMIAALI